MKKAKKIIDKLLLTLAGIALFVMVILSVYQVATRFILNSPSTMSEEIVRFLLIWFGLLSASYVFGVKQHIAILFIRERFPEKIQLIMEKASDVIIIIVALVLMIWGGYEVVNLTWSQIAPSTGLSMAAMYGALPVSGVFIIFYAIYNLLDKGELEAVKEANQEDGGERV
ncbi:TRAP transporter small permease [Staphylococcus equorum]|jgi:TRAP-type C4-dicarboxylate transport system permease small subunit|uniref:TRAP transporter small permease n=1 Tax=Staphylococcus equorum TaxID=246432 RepID=UPI000267D831|nr:TRAP transporter small permease [Staphylococcus equorum]ALM56118.1 C4-dicarboxylate ABC transporter permease [Staphylococcus equorum]KKI54846.1 TRAP-type C4-dicarboxylate transport system, small permease component [Staphylococcus equorum subsp. equorum]MCM3071092.1 TRAP transporter small permease [Staphylococcus equorum]MDG0826088.1 TRAP transporter small permease [Staphylococcus equorum]MDK9852984.1 TRAP transporter small permease [Staphylococcus equorum]